MAFSFLFQQTFLSNLKAILKIRLFLPVLCHGDHGKLHKKIWKGEALSYSTE